MGFYPYFKKILVSEKTTENSERLGRQVRPGFEPGTSRLPVLSVTAEPLVGSYFQGKECHTKDTNTLLLNINVRKEHIFQKKSCKKRNLNKNMQVILEN